MKDPRRCRRLDPRSVPLPYPDRELLLIMARAIYRALQHEINLEYPDLQMKPWERLLREERDRWMNAARDAWFVLAERMGAHAVDVHEPAK